MLHQTIKDQVKEAMLSKDSVRLNTIRGLVAAFTNELVAKRKKPTEILSDDEVLDVIRRSVKQRKDSIEQFKAGGREDLAEAESAELKILETYLPAQMSEEEIRNFVKGKIAEVGEIDKTKLGMFTGTIMKELKGKADGSLVKKIIDTIIIEIPFSLLP